jgi:TolA-binding protein
MSDPKRLLSDDSDADALERALLESLHGEAPSERDKALIWQSVSAGIAAASIVGASAGVAASGGAAGVSAKAAATGAVTTGAGSALSQALVVKGALALALAAASAGGGIALYGRQAPSSATRPAMKQSAVTAPEATLPAPVANPATQEPAHEEPASTRADDESEPPNERAGVARARRAPNRKAAPDQLARESALLAEARAALRGGDLNAAEQELERLARSFPRGVLIQESEVLAIELLLARGRNDEARAHAARFVAAHPESPHSQKLERLLR